MVFACFGGRRVARWKSCEQRPMIQSDKIFQISRGYLVERSMIVPLLFIRSIPMMRIHSNRKALVNSWHFSIVGTYGIRTTDGRRKAEGKASTNIPLQFMTIRERGGSQTRSFRLDVCWENLISGRSHIYHIIVHKRKLVPELTQ